MRRMSIGFKLAFPLALMTALCFGLMFAILRVSLDRYDRSIADKSREILLDGYRKELRSATELAANLIQNVYRTPGLTDEAKLETARALVRPLRFGTEGYYYAYRAGNGVNLIHGLTPANEGKSLWDLQSPDGKQYIIRDLDAAANKGDIFVRFFWSKPGGEKGAVYPKLGTAMMVPGTDIWVGTGEYVDGIDREMAVTTANFRAISDRLGGLILVVFAAFAIVFITVSVLRIRQIVKPIGYLSAYLVRTGGTDFSAKLVRKPGRYRDEVDELYRSLEDMMDRFSGTLAKTRETSLRSRDTSLAMKEASAVISGSIDEAGHVVTAIREGAETLDAEARRDSMVGRELETFIGATTALFAAQSMGLTEAIASVKGVSQATIGISEEADRHADTARVLDETARRGETDVAETARTLSTASEHAAAIGEVIEMIEEIAGQTSLLAMNAAIEAAHAGDAGRGFSVVASEIKTLAEKAQANADEISGRLKIIAESIEKSRGSANRVLDSFREILSKAALVSTGLELIKKSTERLVTEKAAIDENLEFLNKQSDLVSASSDEAEKKLADLSSSIAGLAGMSGTTKADLELLERSLADMEKNAAGVREDADRASREAESLAELVMSFKTGSEESEA
jgi:methyl-accepting chemotaxis protein